MSPTQVSSCLGLLFLTAAFARGEAVIEGHVKLPKPHVAPVVNMRYEVVMNNGAVATDPPVAVVYLEGKFPRPASLPRAQMAQKDLAFVTPLLAIQTGTTVEFPNLDTTYHNIFSYSKPKRFDLGRFRANETPAPSEVFDQPGLVVLHCDIHEFMRGIILVLETPHFTVSDTGGKYRLGGLPAGHYMLKAWVDSKTTLVRSIDLKDGATVRVDFP
jgi:plastocyanin